MATMAELERQLLQTMSVSELQDAIKSKMAAGARNRYSALRQMASDLGATISDTISLTGLMLKSYETKKGGTGIWMLTEDGPVKVKLNLDVTPPPKTALEPLMPITVSNVNVMQGSSETMRWNETTKETTFEHQSDISRKDAAYKWTKRPRDILARGRVAIISSVKYVNDLADWVDGVKQEPKPIIEPGSDRVNLKLVLQKEGHEDLGTANVYIPNVDTLLMLLEGNEDDLSWLQQMAYDGRHDEAMTELSNMMRGRDLLLIGTGDRYMLVPPTKDNMAKAVEIEGRTPPQGKGKDDWVFIKRDTPTISLWGDSLLMWVDEGLQSTLDRFIANQPDVNLMEGIKAKLQDKGPTKADSLKKSLKAKKQEWETALDFLSEMGEVYQDKDEVLHLTNSSTPVTEKEESKESPKEAPPEPSESKKEPKEGKDTSEGRDLSDWLYEALTEHIDEGETFSYTALIKAAKADGMELQDIKDGLTELLDSGLVTKEGEKGPYALN